MKTLPKNICEYHIVKPTKDNPIIKYSCSAMKPNHHKVSTIAYTDITHAESVAVKWFNKGYKHINIKGDCSCG